jgi:hypothetical protein
MKQFLPKIIVLIAIIALFTACGQEDTCIKTPDVSQISIEINFQDLITPMMEAKDEDTLWELMKSNSLYARTFFQADQFGSNEVAKQELFRIFNHSAFKDTLYVELKERFGDFSALRNEFEQAFRYYRYHFPDATIPTIKLVMGGLQQDLFISDSLIMIGLDYFLGEGATFRATQLPQYMLYRYRPEYVVPMTFLMLSQKHNKTDFMNQGLLAEMIYYGKSFEFVKQLNPCVPDSILMGYTAEEMEGVLRNADVIWANFIQNDILYETSNMMKAKFVGERPKTYEIGDKCPGRIGQWVGWEIVRQYTERKKDLTLSSLMAETDAEKVFQQSRYKPRVKKR